MARAVVKMFVQDGVVLATNICSGVFVTFDVDNLESNNQGNFSRDEFHGTAISVTNHLSWDNQGVQLPSIQLYPTDISVPHLPESYAVVQPVELPSNDLYVPCTVLQVSILGHLIICYTEPKSRMSPGWHRCPQC